VARHGAQVTSATAVSQGNPPTGSGHDPSLRRNRVFQHLCHHNLRAVEAY
jgi:hypothetical protein